MILPIADVNSVMDVVADVLASAETIYAASKRARDEAPFNPEDSRWSRENTRGYADTSAKAQSEATSSTEDSEASTEETDPRVEQSRALPVDIEELPEDYVLYMDVPGLQKADVKVRMPICPHMHV